jgi:hypothetical protein
MWRFVLFCLLFVVPADHLLQLHQEGREGHGGRGQEEEGGLKRPATVTGATATMRGLFYMHKCVVSVLYSWLVSVPIHSTTKNCKIQESLRKFTAQQKLQSLQHHYPQGSDGGSQL